MSSFLKSALQLHRTQRPVDGDIPRVPEEPWATMWHSEGHMPLPQLLLLS